MQDLSITVKPYTRTMVLPFTRLIENYILTVATFYQIIVRFLCILKHAYKYELCKCFFMNHADMLSCGDKI